MYRPFRVNKILFLLDALTNLNASSKSSNRIGFLFICISTSRKPRSLRIKIKHFLLSYSIPQCPEVLQYLLFKLNNAKFWEKKDSIIKSASADSISLSFSILTSSLFIIRVHCIVSLTGCRIGVESERSEAWNGKPEQLLIKPQLLKAPIISPAHSHQYLPYLSPLLQYHWHQYQFRCTVVWVCRVQSIHRVCP